MKLILLFMVLLVSALVTSATMNVGTFWFAQNNGKFYPVRGSGNGYYDQISSRSDLEGGNGNNRLQEQEQEVRQLIFGICLLKIFKLFSFRKYGNAWTSYSERVRSNIIPKVF